MPLLGVLNLNKPAGMTSHDVVDRVRRVGKTRKVGHTGTLDPMATGVLPLCLGKATKVAQYLIAQDKEYEVEMTLGIITDSQDITGKVTETRDWQELKPEAAEKLPQTFSGIIQQIPPMISAKHYQGKRLYQLAREGIEVKREPIEVNISELEILSVALPKVCFRVVSSKGTYIRTLCHDMGQYLGPGATMSGLIRTRCGAFRVEEAVPLDELKTPEDVQAHLRSIDDSLSTLPMIEVASRIRRAIAQGRAVRGGSILRVSGEFDAGSIVRIKTTEGELLALGKAEIASEHIERLGGDLNVICPVRVLIPAH